MKKINITLLTLCVMIIGFYSTAQKTNITDAAVRMKKYNPMGGADAKKLVNESKGFIDKAAVHPETKESMKMHYYRGMIYFALIELASMDAISGATVDANALEEYANVSKESFTKVVQDESRKGYQEEAKSFIGQRTSQYFNMGIAMYEQKNYEMAFNTFLAAYEVKGFLGEEYKDAQDNAMAMYNVVSDSLIRSDQLTKAEQLTLQAEEAFGKDMIILTNYINIALKQGDTEKSDRYVKEALELDPNNKQLYYILGTSYIGLKDYVKGEESLLKAIEIDSAYVNAHSNLAALYMEWSLNLADEAKELDYKDPRSTQLEDQSREIIIRAITNIEKMEVEFTENKSVIRNLAQAYRASGNEEKFKEWYGKLKN
jgi:tetratricopeptide (TPR) repeat protein